MKKIVFKMSLPKERNKYACELWSNSIYRQKVVKSKKVYNRKKMKKVDLKEYK